MVRPETGSSLFDSGRRLQILIVGDTIPGLALGIRLTERGFDPLVTRGDPGLTASAVTTLWKPATRALARAGIDVATHRNGRTVEDLFVKPNGDRDHLERVVPSFEFPSPSFISGPELRRAIREDFESGQLRDREVTALEVGSDGVDVEFDDTVRESFDLVVTAGRDRPANHARDSVSTCHTDTLHQQEVSASIDERLDRTFVEGWVDDVLVQQLPTPPQPRSAVIRMTSAEADVPVERVRSRWSRYVDSTPELPSGAVELEPERSRHQTEPFDARFPESNWANGRVLHLSPEFAVPPATGFAVAFGLESARVAAREIERDSHSPTDISERYARNRRERVTAIRHRARAVSGSHTYPERKVEPLATITAFRTACLGSFLTPALAELQT